MIRRSSILWQLLWPARVGTVPLYWLGLRAHRGLYAVGIKRRYRPRVPVICVGNLSMGGTGKTPLVIAIVEMLREMGREVAVLTRGYKSRQRLLAPRETIVWATKTSVSASNVGDEAFMMLERLSGVHVLVSHDRSASARLAVEKFGCDVLVMDDGFQHWPLERDLDIVVLDASQPHWLNHLMPWGNLREGFSALRRAHVAVITKARDEAERERMAALARRVNPSIAVWQVDFVPAKIRRLTDGKAINMKSLDGEPVLLVCGIASPEGFEQTARSLGCKIARRFFYRDHFTYPDLVIKYLELQAQRLGARCILTTEKDAVKLRGRTSPAAPWATIALKTTWLDPPADHIRVYLDGIMKSGGRAAK